VIDWCSHWWPVWPNDSCSDFCEFWQVVKTSTIAAQQGRAGLLQIVVLGGGSNGQGCIVMHGRTCQMQEIDHWWPFQLSDHCRDISKFWLLVRTCIIAAGHGGAGLGKGVGSGGRGKERGISARGRTLMVSNWVNCCQPLQPSNGCSNFCKFWLVVKTRSIITQWGVGAGDNVFLIQIGWDLWWMGQGGVLVIVVKCNDDSSWNQWWNPGRDFT